MPITEELENVRKYESVGFTHEQAETLAETIEKARTAGNESLKDFIKAENDKIRSEIKSEIKESEHNLCGEMKDIRCDMLSKIIVIVTGTAGLLFAAIKLFT